MSLEIPSRPPNFERPPSRVVSLVPSYTESLFDLGFGDRVVGVTDYCTSPRKLLEKVPRIGGPKNPAIAQILELKPDLVIANQEENTRQAIEALIAAGVKVWVTFPQSVQDALQVLWQIAGIFREQAAALRLQALEKSLEWTRNAAAERKPIRYFCPIWYDRTSEGLPWWMTFNRQTYSHDLLTIFKGENVFAERERRYPLGADLGLEPPQEAPGRDKRYPRVTREEILQAQPEMILLPSEPYKFNQEHQQELTSLLAKTEAVRRKRIYLIDGSLLTWHGTRLAKALRELPALFSAFE